MDDKEWDAYKKGYWAGWTAATDCVKKMGINNVPAAKMPGKLV